MKGNLKKMTAAVLALQTAVGLAGCGDNNPSQGGNGTGGSPEKGDKIAATEVWSTIPPQKCRKIEIWACMKSRMRKFIFL